MSTSDIQPTGVADLIRELNESNGTVEDQYLRARGAADRAARSQAAAQEATEGAGTARVACEAIREEQPRRRGPLPRQALIALATVWLDGLACYFAAQALDGSQDSTLVWTLLFLAVLGGGEVAMDYYRDRHRRVWYLLVNFLGAFVVTLGVLRFSYLATIGTGEGLAAIAGAALFTAATAGFLFLGYRALRAAETPQAWRARRAARRAHAAAQAAWEMAEHDATARDGLIDAYLRQVRRAALRMCPAEDVLALEVAVRAHLTGRASPR
jgi:hypothetical protein